MSRSTLVVPDVGCCAGHPCDRCRWCSQGRCCRRDNPDYQLPAPGDWDGPIYGEIGVRDIVGDTIACHVCGEYFAALASHVWYKHDLTAREYKRLFGLSNRGLVAPQVRRALQQKTPYQMEILTDLSALPMTPEQRSAIRLGRPAALEVRKKLESGGRVAVACVICGTVVERWRTRAGRKVVCSPDCQKQMISQAVKQERARRGGRVTFTCPICGGLAWGHRSRLAHTPWATCRRTACTREALRRLSLEREQHTRKGRRRSGAQPHQEH